jgi:dTDP-4-amino-4,6-dideoxygalactose transaminase
MQIKEMIPHSKPTLDSSDFESVRKVMETSMIVEGELVNQFEKEISSYLGMKGGVLPLLELQLYFWHSRP